MIYKRLACRHKSLGQPLSFSPVILHVRQFNTSANGQHNDFYDSSGIGIIFRNNIQLLSDIEVSIYMHGMCTQFTLTEARDV